MKGKRGRSVRERAGPPRRPVSTQPKEQQIELDFMTELREPNRRERDGDARHAKVCEGGCW